MRYKTGHINPWWDDSFKTLDYRYGPLKNTWDEERWRKEGYTNITLNGELYSMNMNGAVMPMPDYAEPFFTLFDWKNVGIGFFRMNTLNLFPLHQDHYITYQKRFNITDPSTIWRCIVFLEDWKSGHYLEVDGDPIFNWRRGDYVMWNYDVPHFAGNIGTEPRYTMQITGTQID
jgi:hypothetical protein